MDTAATRHANKIGVKRHSEGLQSYAYAMAPVAVAGHERKTAQRKAKPDVRARRCDAGGNGSAAVRMWR